MLPIAHGIDGEAKLIGELGLRQAHPCSDRLHIDLFGHVCDEPFPHPARIVQRLACTTIAVREVSWTAPEPPAAPFRARVRVRYRDAGAPAKVEPGPDRTARVVFDEPIASASPGQAAVFDRDDEVVGGGWIDRPAPQAAP